MFNMRWSQLRIQVNNLPDNVYAEASGNIIFFSREFLNDVKNGVISKPYFFFVFLHELAHVAQQAFLSLKMTKNELENHFERNKNALEKEADEIAVRIMRDGLTLIDNAGKWNGVNLCSYVGLVRQQWMVNGNSSKLKMSENLATTAIKRRKDTYEREKEKLPESLRNIDSNMANSWIDLTTEALSEGIHEKFTYDALLSLQDNMWKSKNWKVDNRVIEIKKGNEIELEYFKEKKEYEKKKLVDYVIIDGKKLDIPSVIKGARWNDCYSFTNIGFGALYIVNEYTFIMADHFLKSSHVGKMQFLHSMDCSFGNKKLNVKKIKRWAEFCLDVFNNINVGKKKIQDISLRDYVFSLKDNDIFKVMMSDILYNGSYGNMSIHSFFLGNEYDAGSVAIGSVSHMIQDSFALSHTKRCVDPFLMRVAEKEEDTKTSEDEIFFKEKKSKVHNNKEEKYRIYEEEYLGTKHEYSDYNAFCDYLQQKAMPIILFANYEYQDGNKHKHADVFLKWATVNEYHICDYGACYDMYEEQVHSDDCYSFTLNSVMARDCTEAFIYKVLTESDKEEILDFIESLYPCRQVTNFITKSGLQYFKSESVGHGLYASVIEPLLCYNTNTGNHDR